MNYLRNFVVLLIIITSFWIYYHVYQDSKVTVYTSGDVVLPISKSILHIPKDFALVIGKNAKQERTWSDDLNTDSEAALMAHNSSFSLKPCKTIVYEFVDSGHIETNHIQFNEERIFAKIEENTYLARRLRMGKERLFAPNPLKVLYWINKPSYDPKSHVISCAIQLNEGIINCIAIRLSRTGYEKIVGIISLRDYNENPQFLDQFVHALRFAPSNEYYDFVMGDKTSPKKIGDLLETCKGIRALYFLSIWRELSTPFYFIFFTSLVIFGFLRFWKFVHSDNV